MSVERGAGAWVGDYLIFKECCFRVRVRVRVDTNPNPNPKTLFFKKKEIDPDLGPGRDPVFY